MFDDIFDDDDLDFGLPEFDLGIFDADAEATGPQVLTPILRKPTRAIYSNALELAKSISLDSGMNTYCVLGGTFIFGDLFEALAELHKVRYKTFYVSTLGMSSANVDSLINLIDLYGAPKVNLIVSNYFFGVERHKLMRYIIEEIKGLPFQVAVAGSHFKIAAFETSDGKCFTLHGSANLSSNSNIEQIQIIEDKELYEFNKSILDGIIDRYGIIDEQLNAQFKHAKGATAKNTWEVIRDGQR